MKKYWVEFIGTFFWVLTVIVANNNSGIGSMAPLAIGTMLAAMIYAGGPVSEGHYNPAITLAVLMRQKIDRSDAIYYILMQLLAAVLAAFLGVFLSLCQAGTEINMRTNDATCAIIAEFVGTFALVWVALNTMPPPASHPNAPFGLALGFALTAITFTFGGLSGGAFNPAVALSMCMAGMVSFGDLWLYVVATLLGAGAAGTVMQVLRAGE